MAALGAGAGVVLLRSIVPNVLCLGSSTCRLLVRCCALALPLLCYVVALGFGHPANQIFILCASMFYFGLLGVAVHALGDTSRIEITPMASFVRVLWGFVKLPGVLFADAQSNLVRLLGFEIALSAHSYLMEVRRSDHSFFLLVNPVLVLVERGERSQLRRRHGRVFGRLFGGVAVLIGSSLVAAAYNGLALADRFGDGFLPKLVGTALIMLHSGGASVQIAWMRSRRPSAR